MWQATGSEKLGRRVDGCAPPLPSLLRAVSLSKLCSPYAAYDITGTYFGTREKKKKCF